MCQLFLHPGSKVTFAANTANSPISFKGFKKEFPIKYWANASLGKPMPNEFTFPKSLLIDYSRKSLMLQELITFSKTIIKKNSPIGVGVTHIIFIKIVVG